MNTSPFSFAMHLSIVWGVTLAIITLVEWNSLDRDPMRKQIYSPFIDRQISVTLNQSPPVEDTDFSWDAQQAEVDGAAVQYEVEFDFNGLLFLACFFIPVLVFHGAGYLLVLLRSSRPR